MDQELCILKTSCGVMDQEFTYICNELKTACLERDRYKEEWDKLHKLTKYQKYRALEKNTHKAPMSENPKGHPANK